MMFVDDVMVAQLYCLCCTCVLRGISGKIMRASARMSGASGFSLFFIDEKSSTWSLYVDFIDSSRDYLIKCKKKMHAYIHQKYRVILDLFINVSTLTVRSFLAQRLYQ